MKIVVLDGALANPGDLSWDALHDLGDCTIFDATSPEEIVARSKDAEVVIVNKIKLNESHFKALPNLKLVCLLATGYDNVNLVDAKTYGVTVCNAVGYSTDSVAEHVMALIFACKNKISAYNNSVQDGRWYKEQWSYTLAPIPSLHGSTLGIYGFGKIGQRVAEIGQQFGMKIKATHKHPERDARPGVGFCSLEELFEQCDVISLHAPLSDSNRGIVNQTLLKRMKNNAVLINTGRGGLINETDLKEHLKNRQDTVAGLDVLSVEPPVAPHQLMGLSNCIITPHIAWSNVRARRQLLEIVTQNIIGFKSGNIQNHLV